MKRLVVGVVGAALAIVAAGRGQAVELLISGDFETPGAGIGDVPGWNLQEFLTGSADPVNSADLTGGADTQLFLRAFAGGGPLTPAQGNFDSDGQPVGDTDGADFLTWQRNLGLTGSATAAQGDATGDMNIDAEDLTRWKNSFGVGDPHYSNARLFQTVPASPGETYVFQGTSTFEEHYSGYVTTLGEGSPFGEIPSPTTTTFRMEFLDSSGAVLGTPTTLDLRTEQLIFGFPAVHTPLTAEAPAGTVNVRVTAEALNMAYNGTATSNGADQSAFFNDFSLTTQSDPSTPLLINGNLDQGPPDALDFWNQVENPATAFEILRTPIAGFSNHTPGGSRGVWLSAFFGEHPGFTAVNPDMIPVDGTISQTVQAQAGATYTFSGWSKFEANYSGGVDTIAATSPGNLAGQPSPTVTEIRLDFLDVNSQVIGSSVIDVKEAREMFTGGSANNNEWIQHTLSEVAPAGTRFARLTAQMLDGVVNINPGQSAFFDDFSLDGPLVTSIAAVPEPASLAGLSLGAVALSLAGRRRRAA